MYLNWNPLPIALATFAIPLTPGYFNVAEDIHLHHNHFNYQNKGPNTTGREIPLPLGLTT